MSAPQASKKKRPNTVFSLCMVCQEDRPLEICLNNTSHDKLTRLLQGIQAANDSVTERLQPDWGQVSSVSHRWHARCYSKYTEWDYPCDLEQVTVINTKYVEGGLELGYQFQRAESDESLH